MIASVKRSCAGRLARARIPPPSPLPPRPSTSRTFSCHFPLTLGGRPCYNPPTPGRTLTALSPRSTPRHPPPSTVNHPERRLADSQEKTFSPTIIQSSGRPKRRTYPAPHTTPTAASRQNDGSIGKWKRGSVKKSNCPSVNPPTTSSGRATALRRRRSQ